MAHTAHHTRYGQLRKSFESLVETARSELASNQHLFSALLDKRCKTTDERKELETWLRNLMETHSEDCVATLLVRQRNMCNATGRICRPLQRFRFRDQFGKTRQSTS